MPRPPRLTESQAQVAVMEDGGRWRRSFCLPNYTPEGWFECDLFEVTAAGYFWEYEVKLTLSDFRRDREKRDWRGGRTKHQRLGQGDERGPNRFWFVTPPNLLFLIPRPLSNFEAPLPPWAGLIEIRWPAFGGRWVVDRVVDAPQLHREKLKPRILEHARGVCYWRMHEALRVQATAGMWEREVADGG